jgi:hypothetical protein
MAARRFRLARTKPRTFRERYVPDYGYTTILNYTPPTLKMKSSHLKRENMRLKSTPGFQTSTHKTAFAGLACKHRLSVGRQWPVTIICQMPI